MPPQVPHMTYAQLNDALQRDRPRLGSKFETDSPSRRWAMGILADKETNHVPGTVLLLPEFTTETFPLSRLDMQNSNLQGRRVMNGNAARRLSTFFKKRTPDGKVILDPQPDDSMNDPLNWQIWRRNSALVSLGFYCMLGGGMTPILAAGFNQVAADLNVNFSRVARTTGLFMTGMGVGGVFAAPTAILYGKRPVYLVSAILFMLSSVWCAKAPNYAHLAVARTVQGMAVSPVEVLPSATITEIFYLHERAFRIGIYTLLLLSGKNLMPLISAAIIYGLDWRWTFWIVTAAVGFGGIILTLFVPETFWNRGVHSQAVSRKSISRVHCSPSHRKSISVFGPPADFGAQPADASSVLYECSQSPVEQRAKHERARADNVDGSARDRPQFSLGPLPGASNCSAQIGEVLQADYSEISLSTSNVAQLRNLNSPYYIELERNSSYLDFPAPTKILTSTVLDPPVGIFPIKEERDDPFRSTQQSPAPSSAHMTMPRVAIHGFEKNRHTSYTSHLRREAPRGWAESLRPWNGRLTRVGWWRAAARPAILYAYPAVLWSAMVYALSIGWLIVLSESVSYVYTNRESYNFTSLQVGFVYISPFIGGVLGTAAAGKVSDGVVRFMSRRNHGIYEPEYRLVMALPIAISTTIGLMGFGWSVEERDSWIVPTMFFGVISFGCSVGSTTAITFSVDSYRQYASEALVTLNFSKNILHGLVWSLFFPRWLETDGSKTVFVVIGSIQLTCMLLTIPMYIFGKRARMWTVRRDLMASF